MKHLKIVSSVVTMMLVLTIFFSGCSSNVALEGEILTLTEKDYATEKIILKKDDVVLFKEIIDFSEAYPSADVENVKIEVPYKDMYATHISDNGLIYFIKPKLNDSFSAIYSYDYISKEWKELLRSSSVGAMLADIEDDYLLWVEDKSESLMLTSINLYDMRNGTNSCIYTHTINPQTGYNYSMLWHFPIINDGKVYFEDFISKDLNGDYNIKLFSYDIEDSEVKEISADAKGIMEYDNGLIWQRKSEDNINSDMFSLQENSDIFRNKTQFGSTFSSGGNVIAISDRLSEVHFRKILDGDNSNINELTQKDKDSIIGWGIKAIKDGKITPIIAVGRESRYVHNPITNGDIVAWGANNVGTPKAYSFSKDRIIDFAEFTTNEVGSYLFLLSKNYILLDYSKPDALQGDVESNKILDYTIFKIN